MLLMQGALRMRPELDEPQALSSSHTPQVTQLPQVIECPCHLQHDRLWPRHPGTNAAHSMASRYIATRRTPPPGTDPRRPQHLQQPSNIASERRNTADQARPRGPGYITRQPAADHPITVAHPETPLNRAYRPRYHPPTGDRGVKSSRQQHHRPDAGGLLSPRQSFRVARASNLPPPRPGFQVPNLSELGF